MLVDTSGRQIVVLAAGSAAVGTVSIAASQTVGLVAGSATIGSVKVTDGTNTGAVKAASTAAVAADTALVVAVSPNNVVKAGDGTTSVTIKAASTAPVAADPALVVVQSPNSSGTAGQYVPNAQLVVASSFNRPANTTAYAANQTVANSTTAGSCTPLSWSVLRAASDAFQIQRARISKTNTSLTNASFKLDLFEASPTYTAGDGAAWNNGSGLLSCNQGLTWIGSVSITMGTAGSDGANGSLALAAPIVTSPGSGTTIYGVLSALAAYTPASGETFKVTLEGVRS